MKRRPAGIPGLARRSWRPRRCHRADVLGQPGEDTAEMVGVVRVGPRPRGDGPQGTQPDAVQVAVADELDDEPGQRHVRAQALMHALLVDLEGGRVQPVRGETVTRDVSGPPGAVQRVLDSLAVERVDQASRCRRAASRGRRRAAAGGCRSSAVPEDPIAHPRARSRSRSEASSSISRISISRRFRPDRGKRPPACRRRG